MKIDIKIWDRWKMRDDSILEVTDKEYLGIVSFIKMKGEEGLAKEEIKNTVFRESGMLHFRLKREDTRAAGLIIRYKKGKG